MRLSTERPFKYCSRLRFKVRHASVTMVAVKDASAGKSAKK
jgi:hypothetical protein